jgi:hypothetical protein
MGSKRWSSDQAKHWYDEQSWLVGCNFAPSTASNQLEMWRAETYDPETIGRELRWASEIGMNSVRVFLHDLAWEADPEGFKSRLDSFLGLATEVGIRTMFVIFDDCWFPPYPGPQPDPVPGVHNSRWAQSPGHGAVRDRSQWPRLERYVKDLIGSFGRDDRVCIWDLYNEPGNTILPLATLPFYRALPRVIARVLRHCVLPSPTLPLLRATFDWARSMSPTQPLTAGVWAPIPQLTRFQLEASDVITFHQYANAARLRSKIEKLQRTSIRPVLCTEWLARPLSSRVETHLPIFEEMNVGCYCWGLVSGRTQTIHGWTDRPGTPEPELWHHDLLRPDGTPFDAAEIETIHGLTQR